MTRSRFSISAAVSPKSPAMSDRPGNSDIASRSACGIGFCSDTKLPPRRARAAQARKRAGSGGGRWGASAGRSRPGRSVASPAAAAPSRRSRQAATRAGSANRYGILAGIAVGRGVQRRGRLDSRQCTAWPGTSFQRWQYCATPGSSASSGPISCAAAQNHVLAALGARCRCSGRTGSCRRSPDRRPAAAGRSECACRSRRPRSSGASSPCRPRSGCATRIRPSRAANSPCASRICAIARCPSAWSGLRPSGAQQAGDGTLAVIDIDEDQRHVDEMVGVVRIEPDRLLADAQRFVHAVGRCGTSSRDARTNWRCPAAAVTARSINSTPRSRSFLSR